MKKILKHIKLSHPENFEAGLSELEKIVVKMEGGQMSLQDSLLSHQRGMELLQYCQAALQDAQQQVRIFENNTLKKISIPTNNDH